MYLVLQGLEAIGININIFLAFFCFSYTCVNKIHYYGQWQYKNLQISCCLSFVVKMFHADSKIVHIVNLSDIPSSIMDRIQLPNVRVSCIPLSSQPAVGLGRYPHNMYCYQHHVIVMVPPSDCAGHQKDCNSAARTHSCQAEGLLSPQQETSAAQLPACQALLRSVPLC